MASSQPSTYKTGHHRAVTANHIIRTAELDGAFLIPYLKPHHHILDIGCGPGSITSGFAKYVPDGTITGIDLTPEIITQANEHLHNQDPKPRNVAYKVGNVLEGLPFADNTFDVVFCNQTLLHISEPVQAMQEMRRVCKPGGLVACREADWPFRYFPEEPGMQLYHKYLWLLVHGPPANPAPSSSDPLLNIATYPSNHRSGAHIHVWARQAGFDPARITKGAGVQVFGTPEERSFRAKVVVGRIEDGGHREKFREVGASEEEVDEIVKGWRAWEADVDGWFANVNCEVVCWK